MPPVSQQVLYGGMGSCRIHATCKPRKAVGVVGSCRIHATSRAPHAVGVVGSRRIHATCRPQSVVTALDFSQKVGPEASAGGHRLQGRRVTKLDQRLRQELLLLLQQLQPLHLLHAEYDQSASVRYLRSREATAKHSNLLVQLFDSPCLVQDESKSLDQNRTGSRFLLS